MMEEFHPDDIAQQQAYKSFEVLVAGEDSAIDLALAALLIASCEYPNLTIERSIAILDALALRVRELLGLPGPALLLHLPPETNLLDVIRAINQVLFDEEHFHGNTEDYYNPCNSFFNDVLERRTGIPITLSLLYIEVGKRVGVQIDGIGLPYHFVVGCSLPQGRIYIDPYEGGRVYNEKECRERVRRMLGTGSKGKLNVHWFEPIGHKHLLVRMLNNLKKIYLETEDYARALAICDRILLLIPRSPLEHRDRGIINLQLKHYGRALRDLTAYVKLAPKAEDRVEMQRHIKAIRQIIAMMN